MTKDPLLKASSDNSRELFTRFTQQAHGFSTEDVIGAAANLFVNAIRQTYPKKEAASIFYDEVFARMKGILLDHYDEAGRKNGIFPFNQTVHMSKIDFRQKGWK